MLEKAKYFQETMKRNSKIELFITKENEKD